MSSRRAWCAVLLAGGLTSLACSSSGGSSPAGDVLIGGTVSGLTASTPLVLRLNGARDLTVTTDGPFTFSGGLVPGTAYVVTVGTQPAGGTCKVGGGAGTVESAAVTTVRVICATQGDIAATVVQRWEAPEAWGTGGPAGTAWPDSPSMVEHAYFDASGLHELKGLSWSWMGSFAGPAAPEPDPQAFGVLSEVRFAGGPFPTEGGRYQATAGDGALDLTGDMLVCAIVKPFFDPIHDEHEYPIFAKGVANAFDPIAGAGWALLQSHESFAFHYEGRDAAAVTFSATAYTPTFLANEDERGTLGAPRVHRSPLDPSVVVVCGGRFGDFSTVAVNGRIGAFRDTDLRDLASINPAVPGHVPVGPLQLDAGTAFPATIGGFSVPSSTLTATPGAAHAFPGMVYETAVWDEPATPENVQQKLATALGLVAPTGGDQRAWTTYTRHREALFVGSDGSLHGTWRHGPRLDPTAGMLFGLQGWNRVSFWVPGSVAAPYPMVYAAGQDLDVWTLNGGATVVDDPAVEVPGDSVRAPQRVTLPAGASISILIDDPRVNPSCAAHPAQCVPSALSPARDYPVWESAGPVQGQIWVRVPSASTGTLRIRMTDPDPDTAPPNDRFHIDLASLTPGAWKRVWLSGPASGVGDGLLSTDGVTRGTVYLENPGTEAISFHAWGMQLTQIAGGGDAAFAAIDLGPEAYDWLASIESGGGAIDPPVSERSRAAIDVLELPTLATSPGGFCLAVDAQPAAALPWTAATRTARVAMAWVDAVHPDHRVMIYLAPGGASACVAVNATSACAPIPPSWRPGTRHTLAGCVGAGGLRLYDGDSGEQLGAAVPGVAAPDLTTGRVTVGNAGLSGETPWQGWVSKALLCRDEGRLNACQ